MRGGLGKTNNRIFGVAPSHGKSTLACDTPLPAGTEP